MDSEIICRREPFGVVCEWKGDQRHGTALVYGDIVHRAKRENLFVDDEQKVLKWGGLKLRVLGMRITDYGAYTDSWYVKLDNPHSQLYALYREKVEKFLRFIMRCEAAVMAFRLESIEGGRMELTHKLATKLL